MKKYFRIKIKKEEKEEMQHFEKTTHKHISG